MGAHYVIFYKGSFGSWQLTDMFYLIYFSLISLLSSVCSTINSDDKFCYKNSMWTMSSY